MQRKLRGFTLIELMVVLAIVGILLAIAVPAYSGQVRKTRRAEATARLQQIAVMQEKFRSENPGYTNLWARLGGDPDALPAGSNLRTFFDWAIVVVPAAPPVPAGYTVTATAVADQARDTGCTTLTITSAGARTPVACWK
jgi:type IV pilus assembly protein PilE